MTKSIKFYDFLKKSLIFIAGTKEEVYIKLMSEFILNKVQTEYLINLRLYNINLIEVDKYIKELEEKEKENKEEVTYLKDEKKLDGFIINELNDIKNSKYISKALYETKYYTEDHLENTSMKDIPETKHLVLLSRNNFIKKIDTKEINSIGYNGDGIDQGRFKKDDYTLKVLNNLSSKSNIIFFTDNGYLYKYQLEELPDTLKLANIGIDISNMVDGNNIINFFNEETNKDFLYVIITEKGFIKIINDSEIKDMKRFKILITKFSKNKNDKIKCVKRITKEEYDNDNILIAKSNSNISIYKLKDIPIVGRNSIGTVANNEKDITIVSIDIIKDSDMNKNSEKFLFVVNEFPRGKFIALSEFKVTKRPSTGLLSNADKNLIFAKVFPREEMESDLVIISSKKTYKKSLKTVNINKRPSNGKNILDLDSNETIKVIHVVS